MQGAALHPPKPFLKKGVWSPKNFHGKELIASLSARALPNIKILPVKSFCGVVGELFSKSSPQKIKFTRGAAPNPAKNLLKKVFGFRKLQEEKNFRFPFGWRFAQNRIYSSHLKFLRGLGGFFQKAPQKAFLRGILEECFFGKALPKK